MCSDAIVGLHPSYLLSSRGVCEHVGTVGAQGAARLAFRRCTTVMFHHGSDSSDGALLRFEPCEAFMEDNDRLQGLNADDR